ncbi:uncharacterized protein LOC113319176 [Papaver somniferum]|nr:uncharacterized protein LOC113319176 [Papaver somniferum]
MSQSRWYAQLRWCKIRNIRQQTAGEMTYNCHEMEQLICKEDLNPLNLSSSSLYLWRAFGVSGISGGTDIHCSGCFCPNDAVLLHDISKLLKLSQENPSPQA